jgi:hypothetical protein
MAKRSGKWYSKNEKEVMKEMGLTPTKQSGAGWKEKEDGYNDKILAQLKSTDALSFRLTLEDMDKLKYHAMVEHKLPLFIIQFLASDEIYLILKKDDIKDICLSLLNVKDTSELSYEPKSDIIEAFNTGIEDEELETKTVKSNANAREKFYEKRRREWENRKK